MHIKLSKQDALALPVYSGEKEPGHVYQMMSPMTVGEQLQARADVPVFIYRSFYDDEDQIHIEIVLAELI